jgi:hypothetical protein
MTAATRKRTAPKQQASRPASKAKRIAQGYAAGQVLEDETGAILDAESGWPYGCPKGCGSRFLTTSDRRIHTQTVHARRRHKGRSNTDVPDEMKLKLDALAQRIRAHGWHVVLYFETKAGFVIGTVQCSHGSQTINIRHAYSAKTDKVKVTSAERYLKGDPTPQKFRSVNAAAAWLSANAPGIQKHRYVIGCVCPDCREHVREVQQSIETMTKETEAMVTKKSTTARKRVVKRTKAASKKAPANKRTAKKATAAKRQGRQAAAPPKGLTPAVVVKLRDKDQMSWPAIAQQFGVRKPMIQRLYREAGKDPAASSVGRRNGSAKAAGGTKKATKTAARKAAGSKAKSLFPNNADGVSKQAIINKLDGKRIIWKLGERFGGALVEPTVVKEGSIKVGSQKNGLRVIQFNDGAKSRTVALEAITKVLK